MQRDTREHFGGGNVLCFVCGGGCTNTRIFAKIQSARLKQVNFIVSKLYIRKPIFKKLLSKYPRKKRRAKDERTRARGFPGGAVVKNPPANAGDMGSSPGPGGSHMPQSSWARAPQLPSLRSRVPRTTTTEPTCHNY